MNEPVEFWTGLSIGYQVTSSSLLTNICFRQLHDGSYRVRYNNFEVTAPTISLAASMLLDVIGKTLNEGDIVAFCRPFGLESY
jgi:hypothetical protein